MSVKLTASLLIRIFHLASSYYVGSEQFCEDRQLKLEELCQNFNDEDNSEHQAQSAERTTKRKGTTLLLQSDLCDNCDEVTSTIY